MADFLEINKCIHNSCGDRLHFSMTFSGELCDFGLRRVAIFWTCVRVYGGCGQVMFNRYEMFGA